MDEKKASVRCVRARSRPGKSWCGRDLNAGEQTLADPDQALSMGTDDQARPCSNCIEAIREEDARIEAAADKVACALKKAVCNIS
jgi:hypothetical protein